MKTVSLVLLSLAVPLIPACSGNMPTAPTSELEPVAAQIGPYRNASDNEFVPAVMSASVAGNGIIVRVTTHPACGTIVTASYRQDPAASVTNIVAIVTGDPTANCVPVASNAVVEYQITVPRLPGLRQRVNVFQAYQGAQPVFIGAKTVNGGGSA